MPRYVKAHQNAHTLPTHPNAPKTVAKRASAHGGTNSFVRGGAIKAKGKRSRKRVSGKHRD
jgi:hypothetical protein